MRRNMDRPRLGHSAGNVEKPWSVPYLKALVIPAKAGIHGSRRTPGRRSVPCNAGEGQVGGFAPTALQGHNLVIDGGYTAH
jgi:hypothetical protein